MSSSEEDEFESDASSNDEDSDDSENETSDNEEMEEGNSDDCEIDEKMELIFNSEEIFPNVITKTSYTPSNVKFSPISNILSVSNVNGDIEIFDCIDFNITRTAKIECFAENSCVGLDYSKEGNIIYTVSKDAGMVVIDLSTQQISNFCQLRQNNPFTTLRTMNSWAVVTGDEGGTIQIWDTRQIRPTNMLTHLKIGSDNTQSYVSDIRVNKNSDLIATASGTGMITILDVRTLRPISQSGQAKSDLTSLCTVRNDDVILGSSLNGEFIFSSWKSNDSLQTFEAAINLSCNQVIPVSDTVVLSAWEDNLIRVHSLFPHKLMGVLGEQKFPPEYMDVSKDRDQLASIGIDKKLYIWDISDLETKIESNNSKNNFFGDL